MKLRTLALAALGLTVVAVGVPLSGASLSTGSSSNGVIGSSPDWTAPVVTVVGTSGTVSGTTTLTAAAVDTSSVAVRIEARAAGSAGEWTAICTTSTAPYSCSWTTTAFADGTYDVRAVAVDAYANTGTSSTVQRVVDNTGPVVAVDETALPDYFRGTVTVAATASDAGTGVTSVRVQRSTNGGSTWTDLCVDTLAPYSCPWVTTTTSDALVRAIAMDGLGNTTTSAVVAVTLDNTAPTATMLSPGSPLAGTVTLTASASDADSGVASVLVEHRASSLSPWVTVCTATTSPFTCRWDTTAVADGSGYAFRATATDFAGNSTVSSVTATSTVDNRVASVSVEDPGAYLRGTVTVTANGNAPGGVASVAIQYAPTGTTTWTTICTDTTSPYGCAWDTTKVTGGSYDLRAVLTPVSGSTLVSTIVSGRVVDNSVLRAVDVQASNGGTLGRIDAGDSVAFTYSSPVNPDSLVTGWDGTSRSVTVRLRDGSAVGGAGGEDVLDVFTSTGLSTAVKLGLLNTKGNYVKGQAMVFNATMTAETVVVNGTSVTRVTVRLVSLASNDNSRSTKSGRTMTWTPSAGALGPTGTACSTAPADETGALDRDF